MDCEAVVAADGVESPEVNSGEGSKPVNAVVVLGTLPLSTLRGDGSGTARVGRGGKADEVDEVDEVDLGVGGAERRGGRDGG